MELYKYEFNNSLSFEWKARLHVLGAIYSPRYRSGNLRFQIGIQLLGLDNSSTRLWLIKCGSDNNARVFSVTIQFGRDIVSAVNENWTDDEWVISSSLGSNLRRLDFFTRLSSFSTDLNQAIYYYIIDEVDITCNLEWQSGQITPIQSLFTNISSFCGSNLFSDLVIIIDNFAMPVHAAVLSAHCPMITDILLNNMTYRKGVLPVINFDFEMIIDIINFCYTGVTRAQYDVDLAIKVLQVSHNYQIDILKNICVTVLMRRLKVQRALIIFQLSSDLNIPELYASVFKFIVKYKEEIVKLEEFDQFILKSPSLVLKILRATE